MAHDAAQFLPHGFKGSDIGLIGDQLPELAAAHFLDGAQFIANGIDVNRELRHEGDEVITQVIEHGGFLEKLALHPRDQQVELVGVFPIAGIAPLHERRDVLEQRGTCGGAQGRQHPGTLDFTHLAPFLANGNGGFRQRRDVGLHQFDRQVKGIRFRHGQGRIRQKKARFK